MVTDSSLTAILENCRKGREKGRKALYERFYSYALSVCLPYASNPEDAREIMNDGFIKVFKHINELKKPEVLLPWLRRIMVNTAIDYYRKNSRHRKEFSTESMAYRLEEPYMNEEAVLATLSAEYILAVLHKLPDSYRMVFSLYVLEGFSHKEISIQLQIAESTSRYYLSEANRLLRFALQQLNPEQYARAKR